MAITYPGSGQLYQPPLSHTLIKPILMPEEILLHVATISPFIFLKSLALLGISLVVFFFSANMALYLMGVTLFLFMLEYTTHRYIVLAATDQRLIVVRGIFHVELIQFSYDSIESVQLMSFPLGQIFGYATVVIAGNGRRRVLVPYVENALDFEDIVTQKIYESKRMSYSMPPPIPDRGITINASRDY